MEAEPLFGAGQRHSEVTGRVGGFAQRRMHEALAPDVVGRAVQRQRLGQQRPGLVHQALFDQHARQVGQRLGHAQRLVELAQDGQRLAVLVSGGGGVVFGEVGMGQPDVAHRFQRADAEHARVGQHRSRQRPDELRLVAFIGQRAQGGAHARPHKAGLLVGRVIEQRRTTALRFGMVAAFAPEGQQLGGHAQGPRRVVFGRPVQRGAQVVVLQHQRPALGHRTQKGCGAALAEGQFAKVRGVALAPGVELCPGLQLRQCVFAQALQQPVARRTGSIRRCACGAGGAAVEVNHHQ